VTIRLILDATAVAAFPGVAVGELITMVQESGDHFTAPLPALVAATQLGDPAMIRYLVAHPAFQPYDVPTAAWAALAAGTELLGSLDLACCVWLVDVLDCDVLTSQPKAYVALGDDPPIITF
jgi:hypothetical protein